MRIMKIDAGKIKGLLHDTYSYNYNKEKLSKMTLQEQYHFIALKVINILKHHHGQFVTSYLNYLEGWRGSYYNFK